MNVTTITNSLNNTTFNATIQTKPSTQAQRSHRPLKALHRLLLLAALLFAGTIAWGQSYYVFYNSSVGYVVNQYGSLGVTTSFDPSIVWIASGDLANNNYNLRTIRSYTDESKYMVGNGNGSPMSLGSSHQYWRIYNNRLYHRNYYYAIHYSGSLYTINSNSYDFLTPIKIAAPNTSSFTAVTASISGVDVITSNGNYNYIGNTGTTTVNYTLFTISGTNHYWYNDRDHNSAPSNQAWGTITRTWSLSHADGYASVNSSTGEVTVTDLPTTPKKITLTLTVEDGSNSVIVSKSILLSSTPIGVSGGIVTLDDREDHNWSYYQAAGNLPTGYPTEYLSSPDPRNVKITYRGGSVTNASAVAISALDGEGQNTMVYYKTLEKSVPGMTGNYPYTVISNPFSKRPRTTGTTGTNGFYGFAGWKVISGGDYISEYDNNDVLPLDATIHFINLDNNYTPNCTSAEVVFEATWTSATVKTGNTAQTFDGGTYETNFWVLSGNSDIGNITVPTNVTVSARYPNGTVNFTHDLTGTITAGGNNSKIEFVNMNSTGDVTASNYTFTVGRGVVNSSNGGQLSASSRDANCNQTVKIESGTYNTLRNFTTGLTAARTCDQILILGCDYDRAKNDNTKMIVRGDMQVAQGIQLNR